jgi:glycosyltransferase involved in cell wall biosynthesis
LQIIHLLNKKGLNFCWYVIGEGELLKELKKNIIEKGLEKRFILLGTRSNPYPYIKNADIFVMTSRYEGKSIALDEAKILCKPIVSTKYPSVSDNIEDGINGILVEQNATSIAEGLYKLSTDKDLREKLSKQLSQKNTSNEETVISQIMAFINQ